MNSYQSIYYFIPEFILIINAVFALCVSGSENIKVSKLQKYLLILSLLFAIGMNLVYQTARPYGLFYNLFAIDPFSAMFSNIMIIIFIVLNTDYLKKQVHPYELNHFIPRLIMLIASLVSIKINSLISLVFCIGLIYITLLSVQFFDSKMDRSNPAWSSITAVFSSFVSLCIGIAILFALSGTVYLHSISSDAVAGSSGSPGYFPAVLLLILGLGIFSYILPFLSLVELSIIQHESRIYHSLFLIPLLACWAVGYRIFKAYFPIQTSNYGIPKITLFGLAISIGIILLANLYLPIRKKPVHLILVTLVIHFGLSFSGIIIDRINIQTASIYLLFSTVLILTGLSIQKNDTINTRLGKIVRIFFLCTLIGIPGTSGFIGKYFILKSLFHLNIPYWITISFLLGLLPIIYYLTKECLRIYQEKSLANVNRSDILPTIMAITVFIMGLNWEPFFTSIAKLSRLF